MSRAPLQALFSYPKIKERGAEKMNMSLRDAVLKNTNSFWQLVPGEAPGTAELYIYSTASVCTMALLSTVTSPQP